MNEVVALWKQYGIELTRGSIKNVTLENIKVTTQKYSKEKLKILISLLNKAFLELNVKFEKAINNKKVLSEIDLSNIKNNKKIYNSFVEMRDEHISYFKKFPKYVHEKISKHLEESKETVSFDAQALAKSLDLAEGINRRHAAFIARDQLGKFSASINHAQASYIGSKKYIWRTSKDNRVREIHREREGKIFYYDSPPPDGNPGMPIRCRCEDEAIIEI